MGVKYSLLITIGQEEGQPYKKFIVTELVMKYNQYIIPSQQEQYSDWFILLAQIM